MKSLEMAQVQRVERRGFRLPRREQVEEIVDRPAAHSPRFAVSDGPDHVRGGQIDDPEARQEIDLDEPVGHCR